jgi:hypothetical protein
LRVRQASSGSAEADAPVVAVLAVLIEVALVDEVVLDVPLVEDEVEDDACSPPPW